jgi:hypothetical protein
MNAYSVIQDSLCGGSLSGVNVCLRTSMHLLEAVRLHMCVCLRIVSRLRTMIPIFLYIERGTTRPVTGAVVVVI